MTGGPKPMGQPCVVPLLRAVAAALALVLLSAPAPARGNAATVDVAQDQRAAEDSAVPNARDSITGRVAGSDGEPIAFARISAVPAGDAFRNVTIAFADVDGRFVLSGLPPGAYRIAAQAAGYVDESWERVFAGVTTYYRAGDSVTIKLAKGGVVTGTITDTGGEPVVAVSVRATRIRDAQGRRVRSAYGNSEAFSDDRGVYRIYGMAPGSYVISAGAAGNQWGGMFSAYSDHAPTYHPSGARDAATAVTVRVGEETTGIDIRYRGTQGRVVSGTIVGDVAATPEQGGISVTLTRPSDGGVSHDEHVWRNETPRRFTLRGVPDGEYTIVARRGFGPQDGASSTPRRVVVKGADVPNIELVLAPLASIAGRIVTEPSAEGELSQECLKKGGRPLEESVVTLLRDSGGGAERESGERDFRDDAPDAKGGFAFRNLTAGRYRLEAQPASDDLYARSINLSGPPGAKRAGGADKPSLDVARNGLSVAVGARLDGVTLALARGAAGVGGMVAAAEGSRLPASLRVHLVPAEPERADDVLRYHEVQVAADGTFLIRNVAPGRYRVIARLAPDDVDSLAGPRRAAWDDKERILLRREAETADQSLDLQPCRRVADLAVPYAPPPPAR